MTTNIVGTCESAVCIRTKHKLNRALRFKFQSILKSNRPYIPLRTFHNGPTALRYESCVFVTL